MNFICEGVDRLGKDTLIQNIMDKFGFYQIIHCVKPLVLDYYKKQTTNIQKSMDNYPITPEFLYQKAGFSQSIALLKEIDNSNDIKLIFNRSWLGEAVYAPRYRHYSGDYVFDLERIAGVNTLKNTTLILLTTSNFDFISDDGQSFDVTRREEEQVDFIAAFKKSCFMHKKLIDVHNGHGGFKTPLEILTEVLS